VALHGEARVSERAEALRALIEKVEGGETNTLTLDRLLIRGCGEAEWYARCALGGSLDAVAALEAPLKLRGWLQGIENPSTLRAGSVSAYLSDGFTSVVGYAPREVHARLLAALRCLLHEEEHQ
jgi:hypothetical protein